MMNAQGQPQVQQPPGDGHEALGRQQGDEPLLPHIHAHSPAQGRSQRQPAHGDGNVQAQSSLPDERVGQQGEETISLFLTGHAEASSINDGGVQTPDQGSHSEPSTIDGDAAEETPPIDEDGEEGEEEDGDVEDEDPPEPAPRHPPGSPLRETQAVPCVHEPVQRQLSATLVQGSIIARSMEEVEQTVGIDG